MHRNAQLLRQHAVEIWQAGVAAVRADRLVCEALHVEADTLWIGEEPFPLAAIRRMVVVGGGKAGVGMAAGVEQVLGPRLIREKQLTGWLNVPADTLPAREAAENAARELGRRAIHLHPARPAGINEPTAAGVAGVEAILRLVESLGPDDLCLCLLSGGGSALMPAPVEGITLADKLAVTQHLSGAGANIEQLNTVRKQLSRIKGGGLARACRAGRLVSLVISDVLGDPLDVIASGPTVADTSTPEAALAVLDKFAARQAGISPAVFAHLEKAAAQPRPQSKGPGPLNVVIGNNATAVDAAGMAAERLGYSHAMISATQSEGPAEEIGRHLAQLALHMRDTPGPDCLISGGEPVVRLVDKAQRGLGGRNQQLVLAALESLALDGADRIALLSGGTDGEDGPTDAAGAFLDAELLAAARRQNLDPAAYLARNDAYHFFEPLAGLMKTGPTHTNVCDLRVVCVDQKGSFFVIR